MKNKVSKISTELFKIVTELPEAADADKNKIYCILTINQVDNENKYVEYIAIEEDNVWKWEKIGEFKAEPDLSGYAKLSGATFQGTVKSNLNLEASNAVWTTFLNTKYVATNNSNTYLKALNNESPTKVFATDGSIADLDAKANKSDVLLKKSASGGYYIEVNNKKLGNGAFATNDMCTASGDYSHAEGTSVSSGSASHAEGVSTEASGMGSHAEGVRNVIDKNAIHSVGIGEILERKNAEYIYVKNNDDGTAFVDDPKNGYKYLIGVGGYDGISTDNSTYKSVQEVIADLTARIEQLETKVKALEDANTPA